MAKQTILLTTVFKVVVIIFLTAGNGWAVASYAQKYGMGCKSCHAFGSELNNLGLTFKKSGHSFGEKNAAQKEKFKQGSARDDKSSASESSSKLSDTPGSVNSGKENDSAAVLTAPDAEPPLSESRVYKWKAGDGTLHFSDTPYVNPKGEKKTVSKKAEGKSLRAGSRPLSAMIPKRSQRTTAKTIVPKPGKTVLSKAALPGLPETSRIGIISGARPKSFEECMEQILLTQPPPKTSEAAMDQFREAETICTPYEKKP